MREVQKRFPETADLPIPKRHKGVPALSKRFPCLAVSTYVQGLTPQTGRRVAALLSQVVEDVSKRTRKPPETVGPQDFLMPEVVRFIESRTGGPRGAVYRRWAYRFLRQQAEHVGLSPNRQKVLLAPLSTDGTSAGTKEPPDWVDTVIANIGSSTPDKSTYPIRRFLRWLKKHSPELFSVEGTFLPHLLSPSHVEAYLRRVQGFASQATRNTYVLGVRKWLQYLASTGSISPIVLTPLKHVTHSIRPRPTFWDLGRVQRLRRAVMDERDPLFRTVFGLLVTTGARSGEILGLRLQDWDRELPSSATRGKTAPSPQGSGGSLSRAARSAWILRHTYGNGLLPTPRWRIASSSSPPGSH